MFLSYRPVGATGTPTRERAPRCVGGKQAVPAGPVLARVRDQLARRAPDAAFVVQPPGPALVQLPVIVHAVPTGGHPLEEPIAFDVSQPVPGRLKAVPVYRWDFGGGATAEGVGIAYDGTSPRVDPGHYVAHTYTATGPATVRLTVLWQATFTVDGTAPFRLPDLAKTATRTFPVLQARSELVAG